MVKWDRRLGVSVLALYNKEEKDMATKKKTEKAMVEVISTMSPNEAEKVAFQAQIKGFDVHFNAIEGGFCKVRSAVLDVKEAEDMIAKLAEEGFAASLLKI